MPGGRPRQFDVEEALDRALAVFWQNGYEGASLDDLTEAMGINRPSLYAAFGNKESLFKKAMERYAAGPAAYVRKALEEQTARRVVERLLRGSVDMLACPNNPGGCFAVQGALACGDEARPLQEALAAQRNDFVALMRKRLQLAKREGDLPKNADPAALARYVATVMHGLAVQAAGGAKSSELRKVADLALRAWPK